MKLLQLGDEVASIKGHSWLVPGDWGAGQIPAENSNMGAYTSGARELMVGLKSQKESLVPTHLILSMKLRKPVEQLPAGVLRSSIAR